MPSICITFRYQGVIQGRRLAEVVEIVIQTMDTAPETAKHQLTAAFEVLLLLRNFTCVAARVL
jgi:hypothetical protein